jgi:gamma-glutamyltranspeptidase/glutathione hydrolase
MTETPTFALAAVAAPHRLAAETGQTILAQGGNAVEAMVAMAATAAVVYPHMNGLGGDGFWLVREPGGRVHALDACGPAGSLATQERYHGRGHHEIPPRGPDAVVTLPGAVSGWGLALELSRSRGGQLPLDVLLADAVRHARQGCPVSRSEARYVVKEREAVHAAPGFAEAFLAEGKTPEAGAIRRQPALAAALDQLAHAGLADFYRGDVGREIAADLERLDAPITRRDLETYRARVAAPLQLRLKDCTLYNFPPPTQGLAALLLLGIFDGLNVRAGETPEHHHGLIEATKRAFAIRDRVVTDPRELTHDPAAFLTPRVIGREASLIDALRAAPFPLPPPADGDTIWMGAIDGDGLAVSYIQSLFWEFGSGCVLPSTGLLMSNRGRGFSLDPRSKNPLEPGRKPFHTLNPPLAAFDDGRVVSYGTMGGEAQPQFQAQVFTRYARFGMGPADAVDAPRWLLGRAWGADRATLKVENRFDEGILRALRERGHEVEETGRPYLDALGHAGLLVKHRRDGRVEATHDSRADGGALGL